MISLSLATVMKYSTPAAGKTSPLQVTTEKPDASSANISDDKSDKRRKRPGRSRTKRPLVVVGPESNTDGVMLPVVTDNTRTSIINNSRFPQIIIIPHRQGGSTSQDQVLVNFDPEGKISNIVSGRQESKSGSGALLRTDVGNDDDKIDKAESKTAITQ